MDLRQPFRSVPPRALCRRPASLLLVLLGILAGGAACPAKGGPPAVLAPAAAPGCGDRCQVGACPAGTRCELSGGCTVSCQPETLSPTIR